MTVPLSPASFPVVFFDGERDVDAGSVAVSPAVDFDAFLSDVSRIIGVFPHQISISLIRRKKARSAPGIPRKVQIDDSSDFAAISKERDCFVLAALRRSSRRTRRRGSSWKKESAAVAEKKTMTMTILKRNQESPVVGIWDYESPMMDLETMREKFFIPAYGGGFVLPPAVISPLPPSDICEDCFVARSEGRSPAFHRCVYDKVTVGFRSPAGPIERPTTKKHVVEA